LEIFDEKRFLHDLGYFKVNEGFLSLIVRIDDRIIV